MRLTTTVSLKRSTKELLDKMRGDVPVSAYINRLILNEYEKNKGDKDVYGTKN